MEDRLGHPVPAAYQAAVRDQNPWHTAGTVPTELAPPVERPLAQILWQALLDPTTRRHQIILGPRRVGKTTAMYQTVARLLRAGVAPPRMWWLRLDHPLLLDWPLDDLFRQIVAAADATAERPAFVFMDELTQASHWDLWLKTFHDERWPVRIVGTSSATVAMRQRGSESGVGRWDEQFLAPYQFTEVLDLRQVPAELACQLTLAQTIRELLSRPLALDRLRESRRRYLLTGGFPELLLGERRQDEASELLRSQRVLRSDAVEKALYRDIPQAFSIQDPTKLERLLYLLAGQLTGLLSPHKIAAQLEVGAPTVDKYLDYLERAFLIFTLPGFAAAEETVQRRGRKLYFVDGAVRNAALLRGLAPLTDQAEMGLLVENMAASHLRTLAFQEFVRLYHWRHKGSEVDLVYDHPHEPLAFELTISRRHSARGLQAFQAQHPRFQGRVYVVSEAPEFRAPSGTTAGALPIDAFLVAVGRQSQAALLRRLSVELGSLESGETAG